MFLLRVISTLVVVCGLMVSTLEVPRAIAAPGGAVDVEPPEPPPLDPGQPIDAGLAYLRTRIDGEPAALGFAYMLHRRFGLLDFGDAPSHYDAALAREPGKGVPPQGAVRLFRRMVDPDQAFDEDDVADLGTDWDRVTVRALYCDRAPLPDDYGEQLAREAARGGYHLTHVGMALTWLADNGCDRPVDDAQVAGWIDALAELVATTPPGDVSYEAAAVLLYLGHRDRIPEDYWERVLDEQHEDGGWPFDDERKESHWHPTLLAIWALLENFASQRLDRTVPQPGGPSPPEAVRVSTDTPHKPVPASWAAMIAAEERLQALTPELRLLSTALRNLELPGARARALFADEVDSVDIASARESGDPLAPGLPVDVFAIGEPARVPRTELALWEPLISRVERFDSAKFYMIEGHFLPEAPETFRTPVGVAARARLRDGTIGWVRGKLALSWQERKGAWRITEFRTKALELTRAERPFFREILDDALADDAALRAARFSGHDEVVREFLGADDKKGSDFFPPAMDEHPGLAIVDVDQDGLDDVYVMPHWGRNQLYRNEGGGRFTEMAAEVGLDVAGNTSAAVFADFDNDGDPDAVLARTEEPSLYLRNDGGRFVDASDRVDGPLPKLGSSVTAVDVDADGLLDVYVSTYAVRRLTRDFFSKESGKDELLEGFVTPEASAELRERLDAGAQIYDFPGPPNVLLRNQGDGRFRVDPASPLSIFANTYQSTWADYDDDGDPDVYLANDFAPNHLLRNDGAGRFTDVTAESGTSDVGFGMGATWGDVDGDAREDLYVSNMFSKAGTRITARFDEIDERASKMARGNTLFRNEAPEFRDLAPEPGNRRGQKAGWSWGGQFLDVDNDAALDLYVLSGYYTAPRDFELPVDT